MLDHPNTQELDDETSEEIYRETRREQFKRRYCTLMFALAFSDHVLTQSFAIYATFQCPEGATARMPPLVWNHNMAQRVAVYARWPMLIDVLLGIQWTHHSSDSTIWRYST